MGRKRPRGIVGQVGNFCFTKDFSSLMFTFDKSAEETSSLPAIVAQVQRRQTVMAAINLLLSHFPPIASDVCAVLAFVMMGASYVYNSTDGS